MKDYRNFSPIDLSLDEGFIRWVRNPAPADKVFWEEWLRLHPDRQPIVEEARLLLQSINIQQSPIADETVRNEIDRLLQTISPAARKAPLPSIPFLRRCVPDLKKIAASAAVIAFVLGIRQLYLLHSGNSHTFGYISQTASALLVEKINATGATDSLTFSDGSIVWIMPNSRISYSKGWDTARVRDVYLSGEAFFQVARHPERPFRVITGEIVTKVLGTRFCVRSFEKDTTIQVTVRSGKVSVYAQTATAARETTTTGDVRSRAPVPPGGFIVTCNQRIIYQKTAQKFQKMLLEQPAIVVPAMTDEDMIYEDTPVDQVFARLSKAYGIGIMYDGELMKNCTVTADLKGETFYHKLDLICRAIGASYEVIDGQVVIQSTGCLNDRIPSSSG